MGSSVAIPRAELADMIAHALWQRSPAARKAGLRPARAAAEAVVDHLDAAGIVFTRQPPPALHSAG